jgi:hypothetical protein
LMTSKPMNVASMKTNNMDQRSSSGINPPEGPSASPAEHSQIAGAPGSPGGVGPLDSR